MSHRICNIHVATSSLPIQRLLAWHTSTFNSYSSRGSRNLPKHTIMWNSLGSTWKSRSDSGEHWKGAPPFVSRQCFPNSCFDIILNLFRTYSSLILRRLLWKNRRTKFTGKVAYSTVGENIIFIMIGVFITINRIIHNKDCFLHSGNSRLGHNL